MSRIFTPILLLFVLHYLSFAQSNVSFETFKRPYVFLQDSVSLNEGQLWDDPDYEVFSDVRNAFFDSDENLYLYGFGSGAVLFFLDMNEKLKIIAPSNIDLIDRGYNDFDSESLSELSYAVQGEEGRRQLIFEWKNAGMYNEYNLLDSLESFVNFQVRIHEAEPVIEFHYGPSFLKFDLPFYLDDIGLGMACGVGSADDSTDLLKLWLLNGNAENPEMRYLEFQDSPDDPDFTALTSYPSENTVYRFYISTINTRDIWKKIPDLKISPNITSDVLQISGEKSLGDNNWRYIITGSDGSICKSGYIGNNYMVQVHDLRAGLYYITLISDQELRVTKKFIRI
jgi:hypothetical protein